MNNSNKLLSDIVAYRTYAKHLQHLGRRESLSETINRNMNMHLDRFPKLSNDIIKAYQRVHNLQVMPSMRALQFSGEAILKNNLRQYNCSFSNIDNTKCFSEALYLLLSGVGYGYSVQRRHINQLPKLTQPKESGIFVVHDSIMGWAQALEILLDAYFYGKILPQFDVSQVRQKGSYLVTTGSRAPGPEPLKKMLEQVEDMLKKSIGRKLKPIECHDLLCIISDAVLAGGIRRAALIALFDRDDKEMLTCKQGEWWVKTPWRARANNSALLPRDEVTQEEFNYVYEMCQKSNSGEPGFVISSNLEMGTNPCVSFDTEILTRDGYKKIGILVDNEVEVWNGFEWSNVTPKVTGQNQKMVKIKTSDGRELRCTEYHNFHIAEGYTNKSNKVKAKDLQVGMKLIKHEYPIIEHGPELKNAYTNGFVSAEGVELSSIFYVYEPKSMCLNRLENVKTSTYDEKNKRYRITLANIPESKTLVPIKYNLKSKLDWLSGLFDGDGTELKEGGLQLVSVNNQFLKDVQMLLSTVGVQAKIIKASDAGLRLMPNHKDGSSYYNCQESFRICIGATQMQHLKKLGLKCERMLFNKTPQRDASQFITIVSIENDGIADEVYCFNEPKRHLGIFNGIITGQCGEIALNSNQLCNLTTINQTGITSEKDFLNRVYAASLIGTLQASYTDFDYVRPTWRETTEREALLGVSFTGIADSISNKILTPELLQKGAKLVLEVNEKYAKKIGINVAARATAIKPEGSSSCVLGSSSGVHARHAEHYLRRVRMNKDDSLAVYLKTTIPDLVEDDSFSSSGVVVTIPQESPEGCLTRHNETAQSLLERAIYYKKNWIDPAHRSGDNKHNVSVTISVKENEWDSLKQQMWDKRNEYSGISLLPFSDSTYVQAPFEDCTKEKYEELSKLVKEVDLKLVKEESDTTKRMELLACTGGVCTLE